MKKIFFMATALAFTSSALFAQSANGVVSFSTNQNQVTPDPATDMKAKEATDKLNNVVQLTPDQYDKVNQVNKYYFYHPQAAPVGRGAARQGYNRETQLKSILTSDQWQKYQTAKQQGQTF